MINLAFGSTSCRAQTYLLERQLAYNSETKDDVNLSTTFLDSQVEFPTQPNALCFDLKHNLRGVTQTTDMDLLAHAESGHQIEDASNSNGSNWDQSRIWAKAGSIIPIEGWQDIKSSVLPFRMWDNGIEAWRECERNQAILDGPLRRLIEKLDCVDGFQVTTDGDNAFCGMSYSALESVKEEYAKSIVWISPLTSQKLSQALSIVSLADYCDILTPIEWPDVVAGSSADLAGHALECFTLPIRLQSHATSIHDAVRILTADDQKILSVRGRQEVLSSTGDLIASRWEVQRDSQCTPETHVSRYHMLCQTRVCARDGQNLPINEVWELGVGLNTRAYLERALTDLRKHQQITDKSSLREKVLCMQEYYSQA